MLEGNLSLILSEISLNTIAFANNSNSASLTESFLNPWLLILISALGNSCA